MTYCNFQWLSSYTYLGIRDRLVAEEMLFPPDDDDDDDDDDVSPAAFTGLANPVQVTALVNLTDRSGQFAYVTPLPGSPPEPSTPPDDRLALRVRLQDHLKAGFLIRLEAILQPNPIALRGTPCIPRTHMAAGSVWETIESRIPGAARQASPSPQELLLGICEPAE